MKERSFEQFVIETDGIPIELIELMAQLGGEVGVLNRERVEWLDNAWQIIGGISKKHSSVLLRK